MNTSKQIIPDALVIGDAKQPEISWLIDYQDHSIQSISDFDVYGAVVEADGGAKVETGIGDDIITIYKADGVSGDSVINSGAGEDVINSTDAGGNDFLKTGSGDDLVYSGAGNDVAFLGDGDDFMIFTGNAITHGGDGDDFIVNDGNGDSVMIGGAGDDMLYGGVGKDTFIFGGAFGDDLVKFFGQGDELKFNAGSNQIEVDHVGNGVQVFNEVDGHGDVIASVEVHLVGVNSIELHDGVYVGV